MTRQDDDAPRVAVIGAGPAGLMAAETAQLQGARVTVFDRMPSPGRKLLLAGRGGLNLTHSEGEPTFRARYGAAAASLAPSLDAFDATAVRAWCDELGVATFVGTSGRVFPTALKTSPLLRAWLRRLAAAGVAFALRHRWTGWTEDGALAFAAPTGDVAIRPEAVVLALGGASWPHLGADGGWTAPLAAQAIAVAPLRPANCGFGVAWSDHVRDRFEGQPLKNVRLSFEGAEARGDAIVTRTGLEGGVVYALSARLREAIARDGAAYLHMALRPDLAVDVLRGRLAKRRPGQSLSTALRKTLHLAPVAIALLREADTSDGARLADMDADALAHRINAVPLRLDAPMPLARAISTAGGLAFAELDATLMLRRRPGVFAAGEMLDWEAPTGGYLLQAAFATGRLAGNNAARWALTRVAA